MIIDPYMIFCLYSIPISVNYCDGLGRCFRFVFMLVLQCFLLLPFHFGE